ncbi:MAG: leucine-rich repeat protein [Clostridia bacterium]|nr:leucine-rich repeat protein [Clostridia bacterium]
MLTIEERIKAIENSNSLTDLSSDVLPKSHQEDYYFVSYSHKDYKAVLSDILRLEEKGLNFWYDTDIHVGENWEYIAKSYISKFQCKGVVFYLSENSILSTACNKEIEYVRNKGLNYFSINLPITSEKTTVCGENMLLSLIKNGKANHIDVEKSKTLFAKAFNQDVIYLPFDAPVDTKFNAISKTLVGRNLLEYKFSLENVNHHNDTPVAVLTACKDNSITDVKIPSFISRHNISNLIDLEEYEKKIGKYFDELPLTHVDDTAVFANFHALESIELPETLTLIGEDAFRNCYSLSKINFSELNNLVYIHPRAFAGCLSFTHVTLPDKIMLLGSGAFKDCRNLKSIDGAKALRNIGDSSFENCSNLLSYEFPSMVSGIGDRAFTNCSSLTNITLPQNLLEIGNYAFENAKNIKSVTMADSMTEIGYNVFTGCVSLESVTLSKYTQEIPPRAFSGCVSLTHIDIPSSVEYIADNAFENCKNLEEIRIPNSVKRIFNGAFKGCEKLKSVTIPASVIELRAPFGNCENLTEIIVDDENQNYKSVDGCVYSMDGALVQYAVGKKDESFIIPDFVKEIESSAFAGAKRLKTLTIPANVQKIWSFVFTDCDSLEIIINRSSLKLSKGNLDLSKKVEIV